MLKSPAIPNPYWKACQLCILGGILLQGCSGPFVPWMLKNLPPPRDAEWKCIAVFVGFLGGATLLMSAAFCAPLAYAIGKRSAQILRGDLLEVWSYEPAEWAAFQIGEKARLRSDFRQRLFWPIVAGLLPGGLGFLALLSWEQAINISRLFMVGLCVVIYLIGVLIVAYYLRVVRGGKVDDPSVTPPPSYLHGDYLYANHRFILGLPYQRLVSIAIGNGHPNSLELDIEETHPRGIELVERHRILIPTGKEQAARDLVQKLLIAWQLSKPNESAIDATNR